MPAEEASVVLPATPTLRLSAISTGRTISAGPSLASMLLSPKAGRACLDRSGMPSCRDVARLNELLRTMAALVSQIAELPEDIPAQTTASPDRPTSSPECNQDALRKQAAEAAAEVFLEMSQQCAREDQRETVATLARCMLLLMGRSPAGSTTKAEQSQRTDAQQAQQQVSELQAQVTATAQQLAQARQQAAAEVEKLQQQLLSHQAAAKVAQQELEQQVLQRQEAHTALKDLHACSALAAAKASEQLQEQQKQQTTQVTALQHQLEHLQRGLQQSEVDSAASAMRLTTELAAARIKIDRLEAHISSLEAARARAAAESSQLQADLAQVSSQAAQQHIEVAKRHRQRHESQDEAAQKQSNPAGSQNAASRQQACSTHLDSEPAQAQQEWQAELATAHIASACHRASPVHQPEPGEACTQSAAQLAETGVRSHPPPDELLQVCTQTELTTLTTTTDSTPNESIKGKVSAHAPSAQLISHPCPIPQDTMQASAPALHQRSADAEQFSQQPAFSPTVQAVEAAIRGALAVEADDATQSTLQLRTEAHASSAVLAGSTDPPPTVATPAATSPQPATPCPSSKQSSQPYAKESLLPEPGHLLASQSAPTQPPQTDSKPVQPLQFSPFTPAPAALQTQAGAQLRGEDIGTDPSLSDWSTQGGFSGLFGGLPTGKDIKGAFGAIISPWAGNTTTPMQPASGSEQTRPPVPASPFLSRANDALPGDVIKAQWAAPHFGSSKLQDDDDSLSFASARSSRASSFSSVASSDRELSASRSTSALLSQAGPHPTATPISKFPLAATLSAPYEPSPLIPAHDQACLITPKSPMLRTSTARPDADSPLPLAEAAPVTGNTPVHSHTQSQEGSRAASFASKLAMFNAGAAMPGVPQRTLNSSSKPRKKK